MALKVLILATCLVLFLPSSVRDYYRDYWSNQYYISIIRICFQQFYKYYLLVL
jgi:hypothetical protein